MDNGIQIQISEDIAVIYFIWFQTSSTSDPQYSEKTKTELRVYGNNTLHTQLYLLEEGLVLLKRSSLHPQDPKAYVQQHLNGL